MDQSLSRPGFDDIQHWLHALTRNNNPYPADADIGTVTLAFCVSHAFQDLGIQIVEVAPVVCLHAPHPNPAKLCVRTSWSYFARLDGRLFGFRDEVPASQADASVASSAQRWLLPLVPAQYELRTPQRVMSMEEWQPIFVNRAGQWETQLIEGLREFHARYLSAQALSDKTPTISTLRGGTLRL